MLLTVTYAKDASRSAIEARCGTTERLIFTVFETLDFTTGSLGINVIRHSENCDCCPNILAEHMSHYWNLMMWRHVVSNLVGTEIRVSAAEVPDFLRAAHGFPRQTFSLYDVEDTAKTLHRDEEYRQLLPNRAGYILMPGVLSPRQAEVVVGTDGDGRTDFTLWTPQQRPPCQ